MYERLSGKDVAEKIAKELKARIKEKKLSPYFGIVIVGDDKPSQVYVRKKCEKAAELGIKADVFRFPESIPEEKLLNEIRKLNESEIDGFIVQMPLPKHIDPNKVIQTTEPSKDVDGFHSINMGKVMQNIMDEDAFWPATPLGVMKLLEQYNVKLEGKKAVVVGRGNIVGKPLSFMLLHKNATVTICHSRTKNLALHTRQADILVVAVGKPGFVKASMIKKGA